MTRRLQTIAWIALGMLLVLSVAVVFVAPFREDESYFIFLALSRSTSSTYRHLVELLECWFTLIPDSEARFFLLRAVLGLCFLATIMLLYRILWRGRTGSGPSRGATVLLSVMLGAWIALNRGFEVRAEALSNLAMLLALWLGLGGRPVGAARLTALSLALLVPALLSLRYWPLIGGVLVSLFTVQFADAAGTPVRVRRNVMYALGAGSLLLLCGFGFLGLGGELAGAVRWLLMTERYALIDPLAMGKGIGMAAGQLLLLGLGTLVVCSVGWRGWSERRWTALAGVTAPFLAQTAFLLSFEMHPQRYSYTPLILAAVAAWLTGNRLGLVLRPAWTTRAWDHCVVAVSLLTLSITTTGLFGELYLARQFLRDLGAPRSLDVFATMPRLDVSLVAQVRSRRAFCEAHPHMPVLVTQSRHHPFCGRDLGSSNFVFGGTGGTGTKSASLARLGAIDEPALVSRELEGEATARGLRCQPLGTEYLRCEPPRK